MTEEEKVKPKRKAVPRKKKVEEVVEQVIESPAATEETEKVEDKPVSVPSLPDFLKYGTVLFQPNFNPNNPTRIIVVGCGGTGSRLIPLLAQHISNHNASRVEIRKVFKSTMHLSIIDMDIVEPKNLTRQNFHQFDIGKNKAVALAERFSALFGLQVNAYTGMFEEVYGELTAGDSGGEYNYIIFDCTDNVKARRSVESLFAGYAVLVSCGNEDKFGQVLISTLNGVKQFDSLRETALMVGDMVSNPTPGVINVIKSLPTLLNLFRNFRDTETASCVELNIEEQSMPINSLVAHVAFNAFYQIMSGERLNYFMCKCNVYNGYNTSFISNPRETFNHFLRGIYGFFNEDLPTRFREMESSIRTLGTTPNFTDIKALIDRHGIFCYPAIKDYSEQMIIRKIGTDSNREELSTILRNMEQELQTLGA